MEHFHAGKLYSLPEDESPLWFVQALDHIADTQTHPIAVGLLIRGGDWIVGTLGPSDGGFVTLDVDGELVRVYAVEIEGFRLAADPPPAGSDEIRP